MTNIVRIVTVAVAIAVAAAASASAQERVNVGVRVNMQDCTVQWTVGREQTDDPTLWKVITVDNELVYKQPEDFEGRVFDTGRVSLLPFLGVDQAGYVWAHGRVTLDGTTLGQGETHRRVVCGPVQSDEQSSPLPLPVNPAKPAKPCVNPSRKLRFEIRPNPAPRRGNVTLTVRGKKLRRVTLRVGTERRTVKLRKTGLDRFQRTISTRRFGPPFPGRVNVTAKAHQQRCNGTVSLAGVWKRRTLDP